MIFDMRNVLIAVLLAFSGIALYFHFKPEPAPTGVHMTAMTAPEVAKVPRVEVAVAAPLKVYAPKSKARLKLPETIQQDSAQHVAASTKTANDERQHTITTLVNSSTGDFTTLDRVEPLPWLAVNTKSEVGAFIGLKNGEPAIRLTGHQDFLQIKAVRIGATATADLLQSGRVDTFIGVGMGVRW